jgi:hypothetical protein
MLAANRIGADFDPFMPATHRRTGLERRMSESFPAIAFT